MSCKGIWLLFDLDGTVTPMPHKVHGKYLPLTESACNEPLKEFIRQEGRVCIISTAGKRMWMQIYEPLKDVLKELYVKHTAEAGNDELAEKQKLEEGRFVLSAFTGATMYYNQGPDAHLVEDKDYRLQRKTTFATEHVPAILDLLRQAIITIFTVAASDPSYVKILSKKYHVVFEHLLAVREKEGASKFEETYLSLDKITKHGEYLKDSNDALLDVQFVVGIDEKVVAHMNVLAVPMVRYNEIFTADLCTTLENKYGVTARAQPNSVCVATVALDKAVPIQYILEEHATKSYLRNFVPGAALCAGDNVDSVDRPFTQFPQVGCISVGTKKLSDEVLRDLRKNCRKLVEVGDEEDGTAKFLTTLLHNAASKAPSSSSPSWEEHATEILDKTMDHYDQLKKENGVSNL